MQGLTSDPDQRDHVRDVFERLNPRSDSNIHNPSPIHGMSDGIRPPAFDLPVRSKPDTNIRNPDMGLLSSGLNDMKIDDSNRRDPPRSNNLLGSIHNHNNPSLCIMQDTRFELPEFKPGDNLLTQSDEWTEYIRKFIIQCDFKNITDPYKQKLALLSYGGQLINNIERYDPDPPQGSEITIQHYDSELVALIKKVYAHLGYSSGSTAVAKRHLFNTSKYDPAKTLAANQLAWEQLAVQAGIHHKEKESRIRDKLLEQHPDQTLTQKAIEYGWSLQEFKEKAAAREISKAATNSIRDGVKTPTEKRVFGVQDPSKDKSPKQVHQVKGQTCPRCGRQNCPQRAGCPAISAMCHFCRKMGHFIITCRAKANAGDRPWNNNSGSGNAGSYRQNNNNSYNRDNSRYETPNNKFSKDSGNAQNEQDRKFEKLQARKEEYKSKYNKLKGQNSRSHNSRSNNNARKYVKMTEVASTDDTDSSGSDVSDISDSDD